LQAVSSFKTVLFFSEIFGYCTLIQIFSLGFVHAHVTNGTKFSTLFEVLMLWLVECVCKIINL
jgi:hypothetical protein